MDCSACTPRRPWELPFLAVPEEVAALRRLLRTHLALWGLQELTEAAQLCVSELVTNVITHVGPGTPTTLVVSMRGTHLRIEVHDPDTRALPTLAAPTDDAETGRGMTLVAASSERWGVQMLPDRKVTWAEFATGLNTSNGHIPNAHVSGADRVIGFPDVGRAVGSEVSNRLSAAIAEAAAVEVIAGLLHWLRAHGRDVDEVLDRAQVRFETEATLLTKG
ncbi:ATP-binding protein [Streptomyces sp. NPDC014793]|uniref:ATP-binding protein n=1 Tax=Streptomyces sp. NPDC014793 TaxID=3364914 RepID=UPI0036FE453B